jgi:PAS domain S-box-containing protein
MYWLDRLKINSKFNLILTLLLLTLFAAATFITYKREQSLIQKVAVEHARNIARQIIETRNYMSSVVKGEPEQNYGLVPQVVATRVAKRLTSESRYYVRQVSLRYRNPENRPDDYEAAQLKVFAQRKIQESWNIIKINNDQSFRYMLSMVAEESCLECHGAYDDAPNFVKMRFPRGHFSYNYKVGEVIGAVSVTVPVAELYHEIGTNLKIDLLFWAIVILLTITVSGSLVRKAIITPITTLSSAIAKVTVSGNFSARLPQTSHDEAGQLIGAFNDLMEELERKTVQSRESGERYRNLIEIAQSAIVTFLTDGKIVIANQKAELLLGAPRHELLGENVFEFLEDEGSIRRIINTMITDGTISGQEEGMPAKVRSRNGDLYNIELALSASLSDDKPILTAIMRDPAIVKD